MVTTSFMMTLENGRAVPTLKLPTNAAPTGIAQVLGIPPVNGAIALVGGAAAFDKPEYDAVRKKVRSLIDEMADIAIAYKLAVVDGGTPYGAMKLMGEACHQKNYRFPLVGVAPSGQVAWTPGAGLNYQQTWYAFDMRKMLAERQQRTPLDPNHTAFVLAEANEWGDEVEMLAETAHELAGNNGSLEVLINGGDIARRDVTAYLKRGGQVIVVEGSGRFADELARAVRTGYSPDPIVQAVLATKRIQIFPLGDSPQLFSKLLMSLAGWRYPSRI